MDMETEVQVNSEESLSDKATEDETQTLDAEVPVMDKEEVREAEQKDDPVVTGSPMAEEMNQQVDDLLARPFISGSLEKGVDDIDEASQEGQRNDKEVMVVGEEEDKDKDEIERENSEEDVKERPSAKWIHLGVLSKRKLRRPNEKLMRDMMMFYWVQSLVG
ncbi:hypothetical protein Dimus_015296 [Dionaea muscipula]